MRRLTAWRRDRVVGASGRNRKSASSRNTDGSVARKRPTRSRSRFRWRLLATKAGLGAVCGLALAGGLGYVWMSGAAADWRDRAMAVRAGLEVSAGLTLQEVLVEGRQRTDPAQLRAAVGHDRGDRIFAIDPDAVRRRVEAIGWVEQATVERRLPDLLYIRLLERRPLALWQNEGAVHVVDSTGQTLKKAAATDYPHLPLIVGPDAPQHFGALLEMVGADLDLWRRVTAAVRVSERRWDLRLDNDVNVMLPERDAGGAWRRLSVLQRQYGLVERDLTIIDLRLPDRLIVDIHPDAVFDGEKRSSLEPSEDA